jgi:hypothetical protein
MSKRWSKVVVGILGIFLALMAGGCAFGNRHVTSQYTPVAHARTESQKTFLLTEFTDNRSAGKREDPKEVGWVRNGYGMITAKVYVTDCTPMKWTTDALEQELNHAGYHVKCVTAAPATAPSSADTIVVSGTLEEFFVGMYMTYNTHVHCTIVVTRNGAKLFEKHYEADRHRGAWIASESEYRDAMVDALQGVMLTAMPEIQQAIDGG